MGGGGNGGDGALAAQQAELQQEEQALAEKKRKLNEGRLAALRARLTSGGLLGQGVTATSTETLGGATGQTKS